MQALFDRGLELGIREKPVPGVEQQRVRSATAGGCSLSSVARGWCGRARQETPGVACPVLQVDSVKVEVLFLWCFDDDVGGVVTPSRRHLGI